MLHNILLVVKEMKNIKNKKIARVTNYYSMQDWLNQVKN